MSNYKSTEMGFGDTVGDRIEKAMSEKNLAAENVSVAGAEDAAAAAAEQPKAETAEPQRDEAAEPTTQTKKAEDEKSEADKTEEAKKAAEAEAIKKGGFTADQLEAIRTAARQEIEAREKALATKTEEESGFNWKTAAWIGGGIVAGVAAAFAVAAIVSDGE
jgi:cobalamin biosynthesis Mg chelatase CobN